MMEKVLERVRGTGQGPAGPAHKRTGLYNTEGGSCNWIPFASYCTTGQFMKLRDGYIRHCGPTAAVNLIRTLEKRDRNAAAESAEQLFLKCAETGRKMHIYWNTDVLGRFGGTSNFLTGLYLKQCFRAAELDRDVEIRFHPWITPDAVEKTLRRGGIVYLQVYLHPKYKSHHMLCYACMYEKDTEDGTPVRRFLLADGWASRPVWVSDREIGHGHYLAVFLRDPRKPASGPSGS